MAEAPRRCWGRQARCRRLIAPRHDSVVQDIEHGEAELRGTSVELGKTSNAGDSSENRGARVRVSRARAGNERERDRGRKRWDEVELGGFVGLLLLASEGRRRASSRRDRRRRRRHAAVWLPAWRMNLTSGAHSSVAQTEKVGWACLLGWLLLRAAARVRERRRVKLGCGPVS